MFDGKLKDNGDGVNKVKNDIPEYKDFDFKTDSIHI